jgi:hypothetical protein
MKYLFMDFDGVLHGDNADSYLFQHSPIFCSRLFPYKDKFRIVVSSSWREQYDFDVVSSAFEEEKSLKDIVIGCTPILEDDKGFDDEGRYLEIKAYCEEHGIGDDDWLAVDDMERLFPFDCPNLLLIDTYTGLTNDDLTIIEDFVKN